MYKYFLAWNETLLLQYQFLFLQFYCYFNGFSLAA